MTRTNHTLVCVPDIFEEQKGEGLAYVLNFYLLKAPAGIQLARSPFVSTLSPTCHFQITRLPLARCLQGKCACLSPTRPVSAFMHLCAGQKSACLPLHTLPCQCVLLCHILSAAAATSDKVMAMAILEGQQYATALG